MILESEKDRLVGEIQRASYEAITLDDLNGQVLPLIERLADVSASVLYRFFEPGRMQPIGGTHLKLTFKYQAEYYQKDPIQAALRNRNPWLQHVPSLPEWKAYLKHPVYTDFAHRFDVDNFMHMRMIESEYHMPGMIGLMIARSYKQPDFDGKDQARLAQVQPALCALVRRNGHIEKQLENKSIIEAMLQMNSQPIIAMDLKGNLLWASEWMEKWLGLCGKGKKALPGPLVQAARSLGMLARKNSPSAQPIPTVIISQEGKPRLRADLRFQRTRAGLLFIVAEIENPEISPQLAEVAARYALTSSETRVLRLISLGLGDEAIARQLFVSRATVHTHAVRLFAKMGVHSRVQAALIARGIQLPSEDNEDGSKKDE